ncbi:MAG: methylated-DNA--[protein]-cysteine S-methyltransferase [Pseudomonadota bacterium]
MPSSRTRDLTRAPHDFRSGSTDDVGVVGFSLFQTALGVCGLAWRGEAIVATCLPESTPGATEAKLRARTGGSDRDLPSFARCAIEAITSLLEGAKTDLSFVRCDFGPSTKLALDTYAVARTIPAGETISYGELASRLGDKRLARGVGAALGRNPLPIVVPCHRIVGANGRLTGFSAPGGIETKRRLLEIEGAGLAETSTLFGALPVTVKPRRTPQR